MQLLMYLLVDIWPLVISHCLELKPDGTCPLQELVFGLKVAGLNYNNIGARKYFMHFP